ncbi:concanavalin A-like lectin/glucanase domain-containing protein [Coniella lustricola]|uniref:Glucanase n=1 Tax=Coniella lustricola TaxID=2025994 RepID=A0A2T3A1T5_9PEZI|nr:concanavalin A-like lectin/glucanase domain-containing protein [Coniella lustricola]
MHAITAVACGLLALVKAQQPGPVTPEVHPPLTTAKCTTHGGCVVQNTSVVLDFGFRWLHTANYASCTTSTGGLNTTLCANEAACAQNCVVEGANYTAAGVTTSGSSMTMRQYVDASTGGVSSASPRVYLLNSTSQDYVLFQLLGQEFSFDVDVSALPCGENGALYLSEMDASGGRNPYQTGGATYGSGYCDAQCPVETFKNGTLNTSGTGYCCNEMDILESNSLAAAFTPHPCFDNSTNCDKSGCGFNPYSQGYHNYWAPGGTLDTRKPFTVTTQFITNDNTTKGTLSAIKRVYHQGNRTIPSAISGGAGDAISATWCASVDGTAAEFGNLATMGRALERGMVLAFSIWNDNSQFMDWLDQGSNGPCNSTAGNPSLIEATDPTTHVVFSNIKWGDIGSTVAA